MSYILTQDKRYCISHSGRLGMKWGVRNGPPYPLDREAIANSQYVIGGGFKGLALRKNIDKATGLKLKTREYSQSEDVAACNPGRNKPGYSNMNCAYCVTAYDLRRRGYDVYARDPGAKGTTPDDLNRFYKGIDATSGKGYFYEDYSKVPNYVTEENSRKLESWLTKNLSSQKDGSRGFLGVSFNRYMGHALAYEVKNGNVFILDPQRNDHYTVKEVADVSVDACILRLDDKEPDYKYLRKNGVVHNV